MGSVLFFRSKHYLFLKRKFNLKVYLIRHGETDWNSVRKLQGQTDIRLNDYGIELAKLTAEGLKDVDFDLIYSSPLIRAVETAQIIKGDRELEIHTDDRIKEFYDISVNVRESLFPDERMVRLIRYGSLNSIPSIIFPPKVARPSLRCLSEPLISSIM